MALSLKAELEAWANALSAYDAEDFPAALELFEPISDTSRILTNIGLILATVGEHERAIDHFRQATDLDNYLAIAYFQAGVSCFLLSQFDEAYEQFETAFMWLRGNQAINYEQLGLNFRLYTAEILFNRGLCLLNLGRQGEGLADLDAAQKQKCSAEHDVIDDAVREGGEGYTVFSIPVGIVFRPNPNKIKNLQTKDYLGKARLISKDGSGYEAFDGVDRSELAFRPDAPRRQPTMARPGRERLETKPAAPTPAPAPEARSNLGRSSSDIGGTSAPRNPAGLSRAATAFASSSRPAPAPAFEDRRPVQPLTRAATSIRPAQRPQSPPKSRSPEPVASAPVRGLSTRRPPGALKPAAPIDTSTEAYDSYAPPARSGEWTDSGVGASLTRAPSRSASAMTGRTQGSYPSRSPSQYGVRRALSRKGTMLSRRRTSYEEEEGYVSGDYDEVPFELTKIRVKLHFNNDLRGMAIMPDSTCDEFMDAVCAKFGKEFGDLSLKFTDEDGARVTLLDESDFELAIETARAAALKGKEARLEIWCESNA